MGNYLAIRILFSVYFIGLALVALSALSNLLFVSREESAGVGKRFILKLLVGAVWPLALFSREGRRLLFNSLG